MKKNIVVMLAGIVAVCITLSFDVMDNTGQAGRTGSPGESTCNITCHTGNVLNDGTGSITISSTDLTNWEYMPGDTYNIDVTVSRVGNSLFGIGVECLTSASTPQNAGSWVITNTAETQVKTATIMSVARRNVVHRQNGGIGTDTKTFSFKWVAPATNVGVVTFYAAGNAANNNNHSSGDHIYTTTQAISPAAGAGFAEHEALNFSFYPNPAHDRLTLTHSTAAGESISVQLITLDGREAATLHQGKGDGHEHDLSLLLPQDLPAGVYIVRMIAGETVSARRVIID
jgi:hypothetical protein